MKKGSILLAIKEMHIKTIVRYHYTYNTGKILKFYNTDSKGMKQWENTHC